MSQGAADIAPAARARLEELRSLAASALPLAEAASTWMVGGVVRDALLQRPSDDLDLVTTGSAETIAKAVARRLGGAPFSLGAARGSDAGCWRVALNAPAGEVGGLRQVDVCGVRGGSIEDDLAARDFTINALAVPIADSLSIVDLHAGLGDLDDVCIRAVTDTALVDDPLRMLRAARLAHVLGGRIDATTATQIRQLRARATEPAGERTFTELRALLLHPEVRRGWRLLNDLGLEDALLPELAACRGMAQSRYHHLDVYEHTLAALDNAEDLLDATSFWLPLPAAEPDLDVRPWSDDDRLIVLLAALTHDLGKPATRVVHPDGRVGFPNHAAVGAAVVDTLAARWRWSTSQRRAVRHLVDTHLDLGYALHQRVDARARWQLRQRLAPNVAEAVVLSVADRLATAGLADRRRWMRRHLELARAIWVDHWRTQRDGVMPPLLDGARLAELAGLAPGPQVGELVNLLAQAQACGDVDSVAAAERLARSWRAGVQPEA